MVLTDSLSNTAIADTVSAVLRTPTFARHETPTVAQLVARFIIDQILALFHYTAAHPVAGTIIKLAVYTVLALLIVRIAYSFYLQRTPQRIRHNFAGSADTDWLATARRLATQGEFTDAAHALYLSLIDSAARRGFIAPHDSKTTGDYLRELKRRANPADIERFASFARSYETVIYGIGSCDAERYGALYTIAGSLFGRDR